MLHIFDTRHLLSLGRGAGRTLRMWDFESFSAYDTISLPKNFAATCIFHPDTYLNKVCCTLFYATNYARL